MKRGLKNLKEKKKKSPGAIPPPCPADSKQDTAITFQRKRRLPFIGQNCRHVGSSVTRETRGRDKQVGSY